MENNMKLSTLKGKVKESLVAANDAAVEFDEAAKIAKTNKELLSYGRMSSFTEFSTSVANVVALECKLQKAKCELLTNSANYDRELRKLIKNAKNCLFVTVLCCTVIFINIM